MYNRIKTLEELVNEASGLLRRLEAENGSLKQQVAKLSSETERMRGDMRKLRELASWKERVGARLHKLCVKIDKALSGHKTAEDKYQNTEMPL